MTDRHAGYLVTLDHDIREDDAQAVITALSMIRGVLAVTPLLGDAQLQIAEIRAQSQVRDRVWTALNDPEG